MVLEKNCIDAKFRAKVGNRNTLVLSRLQVKDLHVLNSVFARSPLSLSPKVCFLARSGPPFVIRSVLIGWGHPGHPHPMRTLRITNGGPERAKKKNRVWGRETGDHANTEYTVIF